MVWVLRFFFSFYFKKSSLQLKNKIKNAIQLSKLVDILKNFSHDQQAKSRHVFPDVREMRPSILLQPGSLYSSWFTLCFTFCHQPGVKRGNEIVQINTVSRALPYLPFSTFSLYAVACFIHLVPESYGVVHGKLQEYNPYLRRSS